MEIDELMKQLSQNGINVAGDFVMKKEVQYEVNNVEAGGIGIQNVFHNSKNNGWDLREECGQSISTPKTSNKANKGKNDKIITQPEKQHGIEYPVFSKGSGVTDNHIIAVYRLLTGRGWISTQTSQSEFERLFSGKNNNCEIIWTGQEKLGNNEPTKLGISALYVLFKSLHDAKLITSVQKVGPILESHVVDMVGHFLINISNISSTSKNANDVIKSVIKLMQTRPTDEDIVNLLREEMDSKLDRNDRQDLNYRKPR